MFTNFHAVSDNGHPQQSEVSSFDTLEFDTCFTALDGLDPPVVSDLSFNDLSFLDTLLPSDSTPRKQLLIDNDGSGEMVLTPKDPIPSSMPNVHQKKPRRPSYIIVKEKRELLLAQVRHLEIEASLLRQQAGVEDPEAEAAKRALNFDLRNAVLQHDLLTASNQAALSGYVTSRATSPLESYIHLGTGWHQRRSVLLEMKDRKIALAHQFLTERTRHMNPFKPSCEVSTFETEQGDVCTVKVDVTPFEGVKSVFEVFKALQFYFTNMEISKTELSGKVTIRENEASVGDLAMQHRIVTSEEQGVSQESNVVVFYDVSGLSIENAGEQCVVMASDFVDRDDVYPYRSSERVRKDASSAMKLSAHRRRRPQPAPASGAEALSTNDTVAAEQQQGEEEFVVVLTRVFFVRLHRPQFDVPKPVLQTISDEMPDSIDVMIQSTQSGLQQMSMHSTQ